ncbi:MAG: MBL fold metallo-hydrolase [Candidatus Synoicihabitans palmerolidicus]|nr:MBL fold metallo-hydrolase [Candidatus Synoicihabitans palmerolidicus]
MKLHVIPAGSIQTNAYLLTDAERGEALLIDAPGNVWDRVGPLLTEEGVKLTQLWITHGHWDHKQGAAEVLRHTQAKVIAHEDDRMLIETSEIMEGLMGKKLGIEGVAVDHWVKQDDEIVALGQDAEVRHVPGHCPGSVMFVFAALELAFVGDAIFAGSVGRTDLPGGSMDQLKGSIRTQIYSLPDKTTLYPGHGSATTVVAEKNGNPYVQA